MNLNRSQFAIQDKNRRDLDNSIDCQRHVDLISEKIVSDNDTNTVHHRRDLDSLG